MTQRILRAAGILACALAFVPVAAPAQGAGKAGEAGWGKDVDILVGMRLWATQWDIPTTVAQVVVPNPANPASAVLRDSPRLHLSNTRLVPIVSLGARYGRFVATANVLPRSSYDAGQIGDVARDEYDLSLGYYATPSLIVSLAYKGGSQDRVAPQLSSSPTKIRGLLLGVSGSVPLADRVSLYGNLAFGPARQRTDFGENGPGAPGGVYRLKSDYQLAEIGVSYRLLDGSPGSAIKGLSLTAGYRVQAYTIHSAPYGTYMAAPPFTQIGEEKQNVRTTTTGLIFGVVGVF